MEVERKDMAAERTSQSGAEGPPTTAARARNRITAFILGFRSYLLALTAAIMLPLLTLAALEASDAIAARKSEAQVQMRLLLEDTTYGLEQGLAAMTSTAQVLARSPSLTSADLVSFRQQADDVAQVRGVDVVLRDRTGAQLLATRVPPGAPLPTLPPEDREARAAINSGSTFVSDVYSSGMTHPFLARVVVPAPFGTEAGYAVEIAFAPDVVSNWLNAKGLPSQWVVTVIGRNGLIVAHSGNPNDYVGRGTASNVFGPTDGLRGAWQGFDNAGQPLTGVYTRLSAGWIVAVGAPNAVLARPMRVTLLWLAGAAVLLILTGLTAATFVGRRIDRSVARLEGAAKALGNGTMVMPDRLPIRDLDFVHAAMWTAGRDIAERRINEIKLMGEVQDGHDLLQAIVDGSDDLIFARDGENRLLLANQATATLCGLHSGKEAIGRRLEDLIPRGNWPDFAPLASPQPSSAELASTAGRVLTADGRLFEVSHSALRDGGAGRVGTISIAREVTQRVAVETRLARLQSDLARAGRLSAVAAMGAGLAHELHQPLSAAANFLAVASLRLHGLAGASPAAVSAVKEAMMEASDQVLRTGQIVRRLRGFIGEVDMQAVVLAPLVQEAAEAAWRQAGPPRGRLTLQLDDGLEALVDPVSIQQVVSNLVRNAAEALGEQGEVWVVLEPVADGSACVSVLDTGPGIDPTAAERLFDVFSGSGKQGGLGVGLAICRTIVAAHGGWITVANHERGGAAFAFTLPPRPGLPGAAPASLREDA